MVRTRKFEDEQCVSFKIPYNYVMVLREICELFIKQSVSEHDRCLFCGADLLVGEEHTSSCKVPYAAELLNKLGKDRHVDFI